MIQSPGAPPANGWYSPYKWGHPFSIIHAARAKARLMALCCHDGGFLRKAADALMDEIYVDTETRMYVYIYTRVCVCVRIRYR